MCSHVCRLLPDHNVVRLSEYCIGIDYSSVVVEVTEILSLGQSVDFDHTSSKECLNDSYQTSICTICNPQCFQFLSTKCFFLSNKQVNLAGLCLVLNCTSSQVYKPSLTSCIHLC